MNLGEIKRAIDGLIALPLQQGAVRNVVFWYDDEGTYKDAIDELELKSAKIIKLYDNNAFATKYYIEAEDTTSNLLVYSPQPRPAYRENWLTDIIKYSKEFATDETSINLLTYKMDVSLRNAMKLYNKFFDDKTRTKKFESYNITTFTEQKLHIAILSALCKLPTPNFENAIKVLIVEMINGENTILKSIQSFGSEETLWNMIKFIYDYSFEEKSLKRLVVMLFTTHFSFTYKGNIPDSFNQYVVSENTNCYVFVDNFMNYALQAEDFDKLSTFVASNLNLTEKIAKWNIEDYLDCDTFKSFDLLIVKRIVENLSMNVGEFEKYRKIINHRRKKHYAEILSDEYDTLYSACAFNGENNSGVIAADGGKLGAGGAKHLKKILTCFKILYMSAK
jgi:hypothetical protein